MTEKKHKHEIEIFIGSGNIFADVGYSNPEEALAKSDLAEQIHDAIKAKKLTQKQAAAIMGIDQPKVSDIVRGKVSRYSLDRLMRFLRLLGQDIEIRVSKSKRRSSPSQLTVFRSGGASRSQAQPRA